MVPPDPSCTLGLSKRIYDAMIAALGAASVEPTGGKALAYAIAIAVYTELTTAAVVSPTLLVAPPGGGPVTGQGAIT